MTLPKPTNDFEWATNALNVVQPSTGKQLAGWAEGERPPASFVNWLYQTVGLWLVYLNTLFFNRSTSYDTGPAQVGPELRLGPNGEIRLGVEQVDAANLDEAELRLTTNGSVAHSGLRADVLRADAVVVGLDDPNNQAAFEVAPSSPAGAGVTVALTDEGVAQAALLVNTLALRATAAAHIPRDGGLRRENVVKAYARILFGRLNGVVQVFNIEHSYNLNTGGAAFVAGTFSIPVADNAAGLIQGHVQASLVPVAPSAGVVITSCGFGSPPSYSGGAILFSLIQNDGGASVPFGDPNVEARALIYLELY